MSDTPDHFHERVPAGERARSRASKARSVSTGTEAKHAPHRLQTALTLLAAGQRYGEVRASLQARHKISASTAERDIARAYESIAAEHAAELPHLAARLVDRVWRLALRCEKRRDEGGALAAYSAIAKLVGLGAAEQRVVIDQITMQERAMLEVLAMTPSQRLQEERELEKQRSESLVQPENHEHESHERTDDDAE